MARTYSQFPGGGLEVQIESGAHNKQVTVTVLCGGRSPRCTVKCAFLKECCSTLVIRRLSDSSSFLE